jgi:hypothetical protein
VLRDGGVANEDAIDLKEPAGGGVAEGGLEVPELEAVLRHGGRHLGHEGFALIEGEKGHFELYGKGLREDLGGSGEDLEFEALDVELEEGAAFEGGGREDVVETADGDFFFVEVARARGGREMRVEHGEDGAAEGVGRDVDLGFAGCGSEGDAGYGPEGIGCGGGLESLICGAAGFKGEDLAAVADGAAERCELASVGAHIEDKVEVEKREEAAVAELLRAVDVGFPDLMAGGFYCGADGASYGVCHVVEVSRGAVASG